ncbi:hypothetical protein [Rathayibacter sp. VKM Ac-2760]|uniref:FtsX-like permease family protein n=1 Tax=Rathayibacter sp. VKM Ac-2760 TaxID=2609253 RepID=UPI0013166AB4|nr:hypothetical protein [Rathayibacter sp. VKM Ac-2760]QHC57989.1 hypothetical protein GSU72_04955 [Rathayibacter sp. VKM Ac-2760]
MRRWRSHSRLFALVVAVAVVAGSVLCGALLLVRSAEQAGVSGALTSLGSERVDVTVRVLGPGSPVAAAREAADTATREAYGGGAAWTSSGWASSEWATTPGGVYAYLVELDDPAADAVLTAGAWPTAAPGVALPDIAARSLGLAVGDSITLGDEAPLRIDGLYRSSPETGTYWENDPLVAQGDAQDFAEPNRSFYNPVHAVGPLIAAPGGLDASGLVPAQLEAVESPRFPSTGVEGLAELRAAAGDADVAIARAVPHPNGSLFVDTELPAALDDVADGLAGSRAAALVIALLLAVVLIVCARAVTGLLAEARREEIERLRERGATPLQRVGAVAVDGVAVAAVIALLSPWGGVLLHALVVSAPPLDAAGLPAGAAGRRRPASAPPQWPSSSASSSRCRPRPPADGARSRRPVERSSSSSRRCWPGARRPAAPSAATSAHPHPALLLCAIAVVGARLAAGCARCQSAALAVPLAGARRPLAGWFAARGSGRSTGIVLVALTVGASVVSLGARRDLAAGRARRGRGRPRRPRPSSVSAEGSPVLRRQSLVAKETPPGLASDGPGAAAQILALDARARRLLGPGSGPVARAGGADLAEELRSEDLVDTGPALPAGTTGLQLLAGLDAPEGLAVEVSAAVEDERGRIDILPLGSLTSPTGPVPLSTEDGGIDPAASLRLVALTATLRDVETDTFIAVDVSLEALATLSAGSDAPVPLDLTDAAEWAGSRQDTARRPPEVAVTAAGARLSILTQLSSAPTTYGAVGWDPEEPVGAVLPVALADDLDVLAGAAVTAFVAGTPVSLRMVGDTPEVPGAATSDDLASLAAGLPSSPRSESTIVVDGRALAHRLVQADAFGSLVDEYWSAGATAADGPAADGPAADRSETVTAASLARRMQEAPLRAEVPAASAVVVWASLLLALAGFSARAAAVARSRRLEAAQLRAIGLSRRGMLAVLCADHRRDRARRRRRRPRGQRQGRSWRSRAAGSRPARAARPVEPVVPWQAVSLLPLALLAALTAVSAALAPRPAAAAAVRACCARGRRMTGPARPARRVDGVRALGTAAFLIARRARRDLVALLGILVLTAVTAALAVAVPHQLRSTLDTAAVEAVAAAGSDADLRLLSTVADVSGYDTTTSERLLALADELPERLPAPLTGVVRSITTAILGPEEPVQIPAGDAVVRVGVLDPAAADRVRLVAGELPSAEDPGDPAPVVVSSASAAAAGLSVGDAIDGATGGGPLLRVTGVVEPVDPGADAWTDLPGLWEPGASGTSGGEQQPVVVALTSPVVFDRIGLLLQEPAVGTIRVGLDPARFDLARTETVRREIDALETSTSTLTEGAPLSVTAESGYEDALAALPPAAEAATAQLSTLAAGLLGVAVLVTGLAGTALARRRRPEIALLRSHGASLGLIGIHAGLEALLVTALGAALGIATAAALGAAPESTGLLIGVAAVLVVAPVVAVLRPLLRPRRAGPRPPPRRGRPPPGAGALAVAALRGRGPGERHRPRPARPRRARALRGGDRAGAGRCPPPCSLRCGARPRARAAPDPLLAGARGARKARSVLTLATLVLAASAALTSLVLLQTVAAGQESLSWRTVGADVRVDDAADGPALAATLADGGAVTAALGVLDAVEVRSPTASLSATVLSVDDDYADLLAALPEDQPQRSSADAVRSLIAAGAAEPLPVLVDARLADSLGAEPFGLVVDDVPLRAVVSGGPVTVPDWIDTSVVVVDRDALAAAVTAAGSDPLAPPAIVLAVGDVAAAALPNGTIVRSDVLERQRDGALVAGVRDATGLSLLATTALAVLALLVTTVLGARRRGGTLALLSALGVPGRARLTLAAGELVPAVLSGVVGGALAAAVVLVAAWPAFGVETLVGGAATLAIPPALPLGLLGAAAAALALALAIDAPLSRRVRTTDILRSGEES